MKIKLNNIPLFLFAVIISCTTTNQQTVTTNQQSDYPHIENVNLTLGIPVDNDSTDDFLIFRPQYVLSYNPNRNVANWVSWNLDSTWYGDVPRYSGNFITDTALPDSFYKVKHSDYTNSGYDRGHMVRSEERTRTVEDNKSTFLLTNILPQRPDLNRGVWLNLENYCEELCKKKNKELFVIAGGIFHSENKIKDVIAVPDSFFKIIVVLNRDESLESISDKTTIIAVAMPNKNEIRTDVWQNYVTNIRRIENSTGYDFLTNVSKQFQDIIENRIYSDSNTK
ncbi:MAG: DNA/RNA non-specific endonuclease [Ignavibacteria bacterium]|nr:DNA/RNA non-specific endonuclease [Ignavibacteria bacterium]